MVANNTGIGNSDFGGLFDRGKSRPGDKQPQNGKDKDKEKDKEKGSPDRESKYSPWDDKSGEGWKDNPSEEDIYSTMREIVERDFDETFRAIVTKFLWDALMSVLRPSEGSVRSIITAIVNIGTEQVVGQYRAQAQYHKGEGIDPNLEKAIRMAQERAVDQFTAIYSSPMLDHKFMIALRDGIKKGLKK